MTEEDLKQLVSYRIKHAKETVKEIDILIENQLWNTAINRMYYACFYAVSALLVSRGIKAQTHAGVRQMFGLHFVKSGLIAKEFARFYSDLFDKRLTGDYDDFIDYTANEVTELRPLTARFIEKIEDQLKI